jgi:hypothetical protein
METFIIGMNMVIWNNSIRYFFINLRVINLKKKKLDFTV